MDDSQHHHHHQAPVTHPGSGDDVRQAHVFAQYGHYSSGAPAGPSGMPGMHLPHPGAGSSAIVARRSDTTRGGSDVEPADLFPDMPEAKKRKFILVEDSDRQARLRVRVTLDGVDTREIPDSFRKTSSVYPRSYFPREMQSPPPSATGSRFFEGEDISDRETDGVETEGRASGRTGGAAARSKVMVKVPIADGEHGEVAIPRMRKSTRGKEVRLNDLAYRMAWLQSRVFSGRPVFLQRARQFSFPFPGFQLRRVETRLQ